MNMTPEMIRKVGYYVVAAAVAVGVGLGWIPEAQEDTLLTAAQSVLFGLGTIWLGIAGAKTHRGSDSRATDEDLLEVAQARRVLEKIAAAAEANNGSVLPGVAPAVAPAAEEASAPVLEDRLNPEHPSYGVDFEEPVDPRAEGWGNA